MNKQTIYLDRGVRDLTRLVAALSSLATGRRWKVTIEPAIESRSDAQNNALHGVAYVVLRDFTGFSLLELHDMFLRSYFGVTEKTAFGVTISAPRRSTTKDETGKRSLLSTEEFAAFYAHIQERAASIGCYVPDPDPLLRKRAA